jgi:hypothetical protein
MFGQCVGMYLIDENERKTIPINLRKVMLMRLGFIYYTGFVNLVLPNLKGREKRLFSVKITRMIVKST